MPLVRVKLTISEEPFTVPEDEVGTLRSQGLLDGEPEPVDEAPAKPEPPKPAPPAAPVKTTEN